MMYSTVDLPQTLRELAPLVSAIGVILIAYWQRKAANKADTTNKVAEAQRRTNNDELKVIQNLVNGGHLGNGSLLAVLKSNALNARRVAMMTGSSEDLQAAIDAQKLLEAHVEAAAKQEEAKAKQAQHAPEI